MSVTCDYCGQPATLVGGDVIYPHRSDLRDKNFWRCVPCAAWVGCHPKNAREKGLGTGSVPLGRLANGELRRAKSAAHAVFDQLWRSKRMGRREAYGWLAEQLGVPQSECHIGMMDVDQCKAVVAAMRARKADDLAALEAEHFGDPNQQTGIYALKG
jgi:hypothetical protein